MQIKKGILVAGLVLVGGVFLSACSGNTANYSEKRQVNQQQEIYVKSQPLPAFDWSLERHIFVELYKARNNAVNTYSYVRNFNGQVVFTCKSIGFPLPANMQLTNPEALQGEYRDSTAIPQAEPNGLYSSPSSMGTYIFCLNSDGSISPTYFEADVETHLSPLTDDGKTLAKDGELKIQTKQ